MPTFTETLGQALTWLNTNWTYVGAALVLLVIVASLRVAFDR